MPTALDARSHAKLRFKRSSQEQSGKIEVLKSSHPQNTKIKVEGTLFNPTSGIYAIGVMEQGSDDLFIYEANPFSVQALVGDILASCEDDGSNMSSYLEKKKDLINTYAPVKKQRQLRAAVNAIVSDEKIEGYEESMVSMKQSLKEAAEAAESKLKDQQQMTGVLGQMRDLLPPFNLEATTASGIYDFSALFPESLVSTIDPTDTNTTCHALLRWIHEDFVPPSSTATDAEEPFLEMKRTRSVAQLGRLFVSAKQEKRKTFAKLLNIFTSMVALYKLRKKKTWTPYEVYANDELATKLGELYSPDKRVGGMIDREGAHRLLAHIVLFVLRLTPYWEFDFTDLKIDLNLQAKELQAIIAFCGITIRGSKTGLVGTLKAPLVIQPAGGYRKGAGPKRK